MAAGGVAGCYVWRTLAGVPASAARVEVWWDVGHVRVNRDGLGSRNAIGVNGTLPVPPVQITEGDTLVLHVRNSLSVTTSIHAHGILQTGTPFMDGAAMVTQCGIPPNSSFTYEYQINQAGTFWLHGHDNHQNADGLRAPLVVHDRYPPVKYDYEYLLAFEDWYHAEFAVRMDATQNPLLPFPPPPSFPSVLVNGAYGNSTRPLLFRPGSTYRIRLINMATTEWIHFSMPGHQLCVIEADGVYTEPRPAASLSLGPGQRYSVLVTAHNSTAFNYRYHAALYASFVPQRDGANPRRLSGLIEYRAGAPVADDAPTAEEDNAVLSGAVELLPLGDGSDVQLRTLHGQPALPVDRTLSLVVGGARYTDSITRDVINNVTYARPLVPTLYSALTMGGKAMLPVVYGPQTNTVVLRSGENVELTLINPSSLPHIIHLHGHVFQIIEYGPVDLRLFPGLNANLTGIPVRRFAGWPMERDTVVIPKLNYATIRFCANNPGVWLLHCHMDVHFAMGMAMTFVEAPDVLQKTLRVPNAMIQMCSEQGISVSGNAVGKQGVDLSGLPLAPVLA
ncbi:ferroxidase fet3 [Coemansia biformis]|uniref:Ferroxidase fet3 n=1 Tax=Coemansia biformis TaxID=1286918 RepID=A0A9W7YBN8_9FUNG|nr:ferroxidase fet3 [Coemansia biformis]